MPALPSLPVRGRDAELSSLEEHLERVRAGAGSVVLIEGGPGLGKTRLLQAAWARAEGMAFRVGRGMADPIESVVELAALMEALFEGDPPLVEGAALRDIHAAPEQRFWLLQDIQALLEQAALNHPLLICLDDMQWADSGTAAALRSLPQRLASLPVAWFLTTRPHQGSAQILTALAELVDAGADLHRLGPLDQQAVGQIVADILQAQPDEDLLRRAERIRGNPFLLVDFIRGLKEEKIVARGVRAGDSHRGPSAQPSERRYAPTLVEAAWRCRAGSHRRRVAGPAIFSRGHRRHDRPAPTKTVVTDPHARAGRHPRRKRRPSCVWS